MPIVHQPTILLLSDDPALLSTVEPVLRSIGVETKIALSAEHAIAACAEQVAPELILMDGSLQGSQAGRVLAAVRETVRGPHVAVVLLADSVSEEWAGRLAEGVLDDLIPRDPGNPHWRVRLETVLRTYHRMRELERLRDSSLQNARTDALTGVTNRTTMVAMLFRETDRAQRMRTPLSLLEFDVDDFGHWNAELGADACDGLLRAIAARAGRVFRSYDLFGRSGEDEFLAVLPGCTTYDATLLAERLRTEVFSENFAVHGRVVRLSACFGVASSGGRSPVVVLRETELALREAKAAGPESIRCFRTYGGAEDEASLFAVHPVESESETEA